MIEIISTELKGIKDLVNASKTVSSTVVGYRYGEIRVFRGIAYIATSLGRGVWYVLFTKNINPINENTQALEFTSDNEVREVSINQFGQDPKSIYFLILRPLDDDIVKSLLKR